eukprot:m.277687 g.277687  ORF g.277687 m.277687 type:complete len:805 (+) comp15731_c0_seq6:355-2769(+)
MPRGTVAPTGRGRRGKGRVLPTPSRKLPIAPASPHTTARVQPQPQSTSEQPQQSHMQHIASTPVKEGQRRAQHTPSSHAARRTSKDIRRATRAMFLQEIFENFYQCFEDIAKLVVQPCKERQLLSLESFGTVFPSSILTLQGRAAFVSSVLSERHASWTQQTCVGDVSYRWSHGRTDNASAGDMAAMVPAERRVRIEPVLLVYANSHKHQIALAAQCCQDSARFCGVICDALCGSESLRKVAQAHARRRKATSMASSTARRNSAGSIGSSGSGSGTSIVNASATGMSSHESSALPSQGVLDALCAVKVLPSTLRPEVQVDVAIECLRAWLALPLTLSSRCAKAIDELVQATQSSHPDHPFLLQCRSDFLAIVQATERLRVGVDLTCHVPDVSTTDSINHLQPQTMDSSKATTSVTASSSVPSSRPVSMDVDRLIGRPSSAKSSDNVSSTPTPTPLDQRAPTPSDPLTRMKLVDLPPHLTPHEAMTPRRAETGTVDGLNDTKGEDKTAPHMKQKPNSLSSQSQTKLFISNPNGFTHVVHMGPDSVLFGGLSAAAKRDLLKVTPGRRSASSSSLPTPHTHAPNADNLVTDSTKDAPSTTRLPDAAQASLSSTAAPTARSKVGSPIPFNGTLPSPEETMAAMLARTDLIDVQPDRTTAQTASTAMSSAATSSTATARSTKTGKLQKQRSSMFDIFRKNKRAQPSGSRTTLDVSGPTNFSHVAHVSPETSTASMLKRAPKGAPPPPVLDYDETEQGQGSVGDTMVGRSIDCSDDVQQHSKGSEQGPEGQPAEGEPTHASSTNTSEVFL